MSSPLTFFRRNQKILLAVFGVLIMLTFVVGDYISRYQGGSSGKAVDTTVVTWKGGKIDERELWVMRDAHNRTVRFLDLLIQKTLQGGGQPRGLGVNIANGRVFDPGIPRSYAEEDLVQTILLARKAQDIGVRISDRALDDFLDNLTDGVVERSEFASLLKEATQGMFDRSQLFDQLRIELSAQHVRMMAGSGVFAMSPALAWDGFNRLNRRVKAELLPLAVADFDSKVTAEPTAAQIETLYEEGKNRYPSPDSPEAGFKRRRKIAFQYLKADFEKFLQTEMAAVTKEQVEEYYEKNKSDFKVTEAPPAGTDATPPAGPPAAPAGDPAVKPEAEPAKQPPVEAPAAGDAKDAAAKEPSAKDAGAEEPKPPEAGLKRNEPASNNSPPPAAEPKQSRRVPRQSDNAFAFVSYNAAEEAAPAPAAPESAPPAGDAPADSAAPAATAGKEAPAEPKAEPAPAAAAKPEAAPAPAAASKDPATEAPSGEANNDQPVKYKPLAEVEEEIRRNLARAPAQDKATAALKAARAVIDKHFREYASWQARTKAKTEGSIPEPTPPDINELAKSQGLVAGEITPAVDELEIERYELGQAYNFSIVGNQFRRQSFAEIAYADRQPLYKADQIRSIVNVEFLYWKVKDEEPFVPQLADIRDEVVKAWKHAEAYRLAKLEAEKMAKDLPGDKPLKESLPEAQAKLVLEPAEFTWLTRGAMPMGTGAPMMNSVDGVEFPGHDFMRAVFALKPGQVGTAANSPQTTVYVVRIAAESPDEETRRKQFIEGGLTGEMGFLARVELQTFLSQWYRDLDKEMDVHWVRPPQAMQMVE